MIYLLNFIVEELTNPFQDPRQKYKEMTSQELFFRLTKETPWSFFKYMIVSAQVEKVFVDKVIVKLMDNNLKGVIPVQEVDDGDFKKKDLAQLFQPGDVLKVIVKHVDALEKSAAQNQNKKDVLRVELALKRPAKWEALLPELHARWEEQRGTFLFVKEEDYPQFQNKVFSQQLKYNQRQIQISHPKFKQMSLVSSLEYIKG